MISNLQGFLLSPRFLCFFLLVLKDAAGLARKSAFQYSGVPAVFHQRAPDDAAQGWKNGRQCPHLGYAVDWRTNPERKTSGTLAVNISRDKQDTLP